MKEFVEKQLARLEENDEALSGDLDEAMHAESDEDEKKEQKENAEMKL